MTQEITKPREFWITFGNHVTLVDTFPPRADAIIPAIHVIEMSALTDAKAEIDRLKHSPHAENYISQLEDDIKARDAEIAELKEMMPKMADSIPWASKLNRELGEKKLHEANAMIETLHMQLAGCGVAAKCNTRETMELQRIGRDNPNWCLSYADVIEAVEREISNREMIETLAETLELIKDYDCGDCSVAAEQSLARVRKALK